MLRENPLPVLLHDLDSTSPAACGSACPYYARSFPEPVGRTCYGEALAIMEVWGEVTVTAESPLSHVQARICCP